MKILKTGAKECFEDLPLLVNWSLTTNCNYRCSYCFIYGKGKNPPPPTPFSTLEQLRTAVNNIASLNRPNYDVGLTGGEPTFHPHFFDVISMLHETLGQRLNSMTITTNASRNADLYDKIADIAKFVNIRMMISLHTDHVDKEHVSDLIEKLSRNVRLYFALMFNPDKRDFVHELFGMLLKAREKFPFTMNVVTLRDGDRVDPRYTPEDFAYQKKATAEFQNVVRSVSGKVPLVKNPKLMMTILRELEDKGEIRTENPKNRNAELAIGLYNFKGMYCIAHSCALHINANGTFKGLVCTDDHTIGNIFEKDSILKVRDKLIHPVRCKHQVCGCVANDRIPKFVSEKEAKKYIAFCQKRQAQLFDEYDVQQALMKTDLKIF